MTGHQGGLIPQVGKVRIGEHGPEICMRINWNRPSATEIAAFREALDRHGKELKQEPHPE
jgi:hypothetical protein